jgi:hypothetical protein|tara:strand:+ start:314 stop:493 length:180 start_codon:yes stop_codon:yes gene_type:complete
MDYLCETIEVNRKFMKLLNEDILPKYEIILQELFSTLQQDIDTKAHQEKYLNNEVIDKT